MDKYYLTYIDDNPDTELTKYLFEEFHNEKFEIVCSEITFKPEYGHESLLYNSKVQEANIILIDSLLFENKTVAGAKFTGEEFKLVLKKFFPFIEVIVITQNEIDSGIMKIAKYDRSLGNSAFEYYEKVLPPLLNVAVENIQQYWLLAKLVKENDSWEKLLKDKIIATLNGTNKYEKLTVTDIDNLISAFKKIQECIDG